MIQLQTFLYKWCCINWYSILLLVILKTWYDPHDLFIFSYLNKLIIFCHISLYKIVCIIICDSIIILINVLNNTNKHPQATPFPNSFKRYYHLKQINLKPLLKKIISKKLKENSLSYWLASIKSIKVAQLNLLN